MEDDLIQRLRAVSKSGWPGSELWLACNEAADALTRLLGAAEPFVRAVMEVDCDREQLELRAMEDDDPDWVDEVTRQPTLGDMRALASAVHSVGKIEI